MIVLLFITTILGYFQPKTAKIEPLIQPKTQVKVERCVTHHQKQKTFKIEPVKKFFTRRQFVVRKKVLRKLRGKYSENEVIAFDNLIKTEGNYDPKARNKSGACGIPQALPCRKMKCPLNEKGIDCQLEWMEKYIQKRYGNPIKAWKFKKLHGWY